MKRKKSCGDNCGGRLSDKRRALALLEQAEEEEACAFQEIDEIAAYNQLRLLQIFQEQE